MLALAVLALAATGAVLVVRALAGHGAAREPVPTVPVPGLAEATAELRRRYAAGEISRGGLPPGQGRPGMTRRESRLGTLAAARVSY